MSRPERYSSVATYLPAMLRRMDSPDAPQVFSGGFDTDRMELGQSADSLPEPLMAFLLSLDRKLDTLLGLLSRDELKESFPLQGDVLEISGSGVLFASEEPFRVGDFLELLLVLNRFPLRLAGAVGRITGSESRSGRQVFSLDYTRIREQDLDAVIRFVFQQERQHIREQRWD